MNTHTHKYSAHPQWKLLMSTCAILMIGGCFDGPADTTDSNPSNTPVEKPLTKGYMLHPSATTDTSSRDVLDTKNISRIEDVMHAMENREHKAEQAQRAHTLSELGQSLQKSDTNNMVFYDIIGTGNTPDPVYMDKAATFSAVYAENVHLELRKGANLSAHALNLASGTLTITEGAQASLSSLNVEAGALVEGGKYLKLVDAPSTELTNLREKRAKKFGWADSASLIKLGGTIDEIPSAALTLVPTSKVARVTTFNAFNSTLHLSTDTRLTIDKWKEAPSSDKTSFHLHWKAPSIEPLLVVENVSDLTLNKLTIDSLNSSIQVNDTLTVATLPAAARISYTSSKTLQAFGGEFQVNNNPGSLSLTLIKKGSSPDAQAKLSSSAIALSNTVMAQTNSEVAGRLFPMDVGTAVTTLNTITDSHTWFHDTNLPYFTTVHQEHAAGAWIQGKDLGDTRTTHLGFTTTDGCQLAVTGHVAQQQPLTLAAHAVYSGIALDFISREHQYGASLGWAGRNLFTGLSYNHTSLTESRFTPLGVVSIDKAPHNRSAVYIGVAGHLPQLAAPAIEFSSRLSFDLNRYMSAHTLGIDQETFHLPSRQLTNGLGVDLSLTVPFKTGLLAFNYGGYLVNRKINQTVGLSFEFIGN
jgi:hypothetical protein